MNGGNLAGPGVATSMEGNRSLHGLTSFSLILPSDLKRYGAFSASIDLVTKIPLFYIHPKQAFSENHNFFDSRSQAPTSLVVKPKQAKRFESWLKASNRSGEHIFKK